MIIDCILDRKDGEEFGGRYSPHDFYTSIMRYGKISHGITAAMDYGTEEDVRRELCEYILTNDYNPAICQYVNSRAWLN